MGRSDLVGCSWGDGAAFRRAGQSQRRGQLALRDRPRARRPAVAQRHRTHPRRAHHSVGGPGWTPLEQTHTQETTSGLACCTGVCVCDASWRGTHRLELLLIVRHAFEQEASCRNRSAPFVSLLGKRNTETACVCLCVCLTRHIAVRTGRDIA